MRVYLLGICGTGVGALAGLLKRQGHEVRGSDAHVYPPMSTKLAEWGIAVDAGFDPAHLVPHPDLVICGNVIRADNPQAAYVRAAKLPTLSMPQAVARFGIGGRHSIVIAGTHGKTTTTALIAHILVHAGVDPGFLVGGALVGYPDSFRMGAGPYFVVEGDEYDTAYFDKGPKFLHYRPRTAVITSLEFDHADIFASLDAVAESFAKLIAAVPADGQLVLWHGATRARALLAEHARTSRVTTYAARPGTDADWVASDLATGAAGLALTPLCRGTSLGRMHVPLWGEFSACNVLAALAAVADAGLDAAQLRAALASFAGVRRRMEVIGDPDGVTVVDDFAHHPTAVAATLAAARERFPGRPLWALFEPRSATSRRNVFQAEYAAAFAAADHVVIAGHPRLAEVPAAQRFDPAALARALCAGGTDAAALATPADIVAAVAGRVRTGDVVLVLSNGDFGGLHAALLAALAARALRPPP